MPRRHCFPAGRLIVCHHAVSRPPHSGLRSLPPLGIPNLFRFLLVVGDNARPTARQTAPFTSVPSSTTPCPLHSGQAFSGISPSLIRTAKRAFTPSLKDRFSCALSVLQGAKRPRPVATGTRQLLARWLGKWTLRAVGESTKGAAVSRVGTTDEVQDRNG